MFIKKKTPIFQQKKAFHTFRGPHAFFIKELALRVSFLSAQNSILFFLEFENAFLTKINQ